MVHLSHRSLALITLGPALSLALAACGSPAVNTNYTPGAQPTTEATAVVPTQGATSTASPSASAKASAHATTGTHSTKPGATTTSHTTAPSGSHSTPAGGSGGTHTVGPSSAVITVTPSRGLTDGQTVTIQGSHFNPSIGVIVVECVDNGPNTQAGNCTGNFFAVFHPAANGTFTKTFRVKHRLASTTCTAGGNCLIAVTQPNPNPAEEADAHIYFR